MFDGDLPPGEALREVLLSQSIGVARSTIREALRVLATNGLVARMPNRGLAVRHLTIAEVEDIFTARQVLEREAAKAAGTCPEERLQEFSRAFDAYADAVSRNDASASANGHVEFHTAMVGLTGSRRLAETERSLLRDLQLVIASIEKSSDDQPKEVEKHRKLLRLFCERNVAEAIECLEGDLDHAKAFICRHAIDAPKPPVALAG